MSTLSICIATHERPALLNRTLGALAAQTKLPSEIILSDSSVSDETALVARSFAGMPSTLKHVKSAKKALPYQRWLAFTYSSGERILFLDDDVQLSPPALEILDETWERLLRLRHEAIAGVGFKMTWEDGEPLTRDRNAWAERWLGTSREKSGSVTAGGLSVSINDLNSDRPMPVDKLWGGAMSFERWVLASIGPLDRLVALYDQGLGRGEDVVLSHYARKLGGLYMITRPLALHPHYANLRQPAPYATDGWRLGMTATWGRAHTLRWLAKDWSAYKLAWARIASLEVARSFLGIIRRPVRPASWKRLAGACFGVLHTINKWKQIPSSASSLCPAFRPEKSQHGTKQSVGHI
jgi:glycosyltransferase involved in cell wall biosynthesis